MEGGGVASGQRLRRRGVSPAGAAEPKAAALGSRMQGEAQGLERPGARPQQLPKPGQGPQLSSCQPPGGGGLGHGPGGCPCPTSQG